MTPERLARIKAFAERAKASGERTSWDPDEVIELVDEVERLRACV